MKKLSTVLVIAMVASMLLTACGGDSSSSSAAAPAPSGSSSAAAPAPTDSSSAAAPAGDRKTSADNKVVTIGELTLKAEGPVLITSAGQSADASMLDALMKKVGVDYTFNGTATADDVKGVKTVIIAAGASSKGLGAAGISADDEKARTEAVLKACADEGATVIMAHLGGAQRRGALSDEFSDLVLAKSNYVIVVEEGNEDGKFTTTTEANKTPITLVNTIADCIAPLKAVFGK